MVDDHPVATRGICTVIDSEADMEVCGTAATAADAMRLFNRLKPDIALVDLRLGEQSGLDLVRDMLVQDRHFPALLFSMYEDRLYAERAIRAGARGYIMKQEAASTIITAIRTVRDGGVYVRKELIPRILKHGQNAAATPNASPDISTLTDRELQVLQAMGGGTGRKEMAADINVSVKTIDGYRRSMVRKLGLRSVTELAQFAARLDEFGPV